MGIASINRVGARVAWLIGARSDSFKYEVEDDRFNKNEISNAIIEAEAQIVGDFAEAGHSQREPFLAWVPDAGMAHNDVVPGHRGQIEAVRIVPYIIHDQEDVDAPWIPGEKTSRYNIEQWRENHNHIFDPIAHDTLGSNLAGFYDLTNQTIGFTGVKAQAKVVDYDPLYATLDESAAARGRLTIRDGERANGTLTILNTGAAAATGRLSVTTPSAYATGSLAITQGIAAMGVLRFGGTPTNGETLVVNGLTITFRPETPPSGVMGPLLATECFYNSDPSYNAASLATCLNESSASRVIGATYTSVGSRTIITYKTFGTAGNAYTLANSSGGNVVRGTSTLTGGINGIVNGESIYVNGIPFVWGPAPTGADPHVTFLTNDPSAIVNAQTLATALATSAEARLRLATYVHTAGTQVVSMTATDRGCPGNLFTTPNSDAGAIVGAAATLLGGVGGIVELEGIGVNTVIFVFSNTIFGGNFIPYDNSNPATTAANIAAALTASADGLLTVAHYTTAIPLPPDGIPHPLPTTDVLITYGTTGSAGNSYAIHASTGGGVTVTGSFLTGGVSGGVVNNETLKVNNTTITFVTGTPSGLQVQIGGTPTITATRLVTFLSGSALADLKLGEYASVGNVVYVSAFNTGTQGNDFLLAYSSLSAVVPSFAHLLGGTGGPQPIAGETVVINGTGFTFSDSGPGTYLFELENTRGTTIAEMANILNGLVADATIDVATYTADADGVNIVYKTDGIAGNLYTLQESSAGAVTISGPTLTGGLSGLDYIGELQIEDIWENALVFGAITKLIKIGVPAPIIQHSVTEFEKARQAIIQGLSYQPELPAAQEMQ